MDLRLLKRPSTRCNCWNGSAEEMREWTTLQTAQLEAVVQGTMTQQATMTQGKVRSNVTLVDTKLVTKQNAFSGDQDGKERWTTWSFKMRAFCAAHVTKRKVSLEEQKAQKEDRFLRGRQIAYLIYEYFRVTGANDSVENYAHLFTISLRSDDIQEFDSKWEGIVLSMTKIPSDDILEGLYKLRIRESEKLKTVLELYDLEIHQKKAGPDYHRLNNGEEKF